MNKNTMNLLAINLKSGEQSLPDSEYVWINYPSQAIWYL